MSFTFLHTADWQIGRAFGTFPEDKAPVLAQARFDTIDRLAELARSHRAAHVLVAGDVLDQETAPDRTLRALIGKLAGHAGLTWHLLPGNHDPARAGGVWDAMARLKPAANIRLHLTAQPVTLAPSVVLLPAPLTQKSTAIDPTGWMNTAASEPGSIRIGLAHGSIQGNFGGDGDAQVPIDPTRPKQAGLAYLALGDWHGQMRISDRCWYAGTHEADRFKARAVGQALVVSIEGESAPPRITSLDCGRFVWTEHEAAGDVTRAIAVLEQVFDALGAACGQAVVKINLKGRVSLAARTAIDGRLLELAGRVFALRTHCEGLATQATDGDLDILGNGTLRDVANRLRVEDDDTDSPRARAARRALALLTGFAGTGGTP